MAKKDIVVVGASAGGMEALQALVRRLPQDFAGSLFVVWHLSPGVRSILPTILTKAGPLAAAHAADGDRIEPGRIYVAPNDHHMLVERGYIRVVKGPKENRFRPALDPLFRSAAYVYGPRVIGVVLSGALDDGTAGLWTVKLRGGTAIVQDPQDALHRSMPLNALEFVEADYKVAAAEMGPLLGRLAHEEAPAAPEVPESETSKTAREVRIAKEEDALDKRILDFGELSAFTCPECHGVLTVLHEGRIVRFRCHTGHAFSANTLLESTTEELENRLWDSVRAFDEVIMQLNTMGEEFAKAGNMQAAERCFDKARDVHELSRPVRDVVLTQEELSRDKLEENDKTVQTAK